MNDTRYLPAAEFRALKLDSSRMTRRWRARTLITFCPATVALLLMVVCAVGCTRSGPATTSTTSAGFSPLAKRVEFLHQCVAFRRTYETLDFDIMYQNNGGTLPGPSDWDIRFVATVPAAELAA
jgi:hypothetical protein